MRTTPYEGQCGNKAERNGKRWRGQYFKNATLERLGHVRPEEVVMQWKSINCCPRRRKFELFKFRLRSDKTPYNIEWVKL